MIGETLNRLGLYRPIAKGVRYVRDPVYRNRLHELRSDYSQLLREVGRWAKDGSELADPGKLAGIVSFTNLPLHAKFQALLAKALQLRGYTPVVFTAGGCWYGKRCFELFGVRELWAWEDLREELGPAREDLDEIVCSLMPEQPTVQGLIGCSYRGVDVGKHALSMTCRRRVEGRLDLDNPATAAELRGQLHDAVCATLVAERFLDRTPLRKLIVRDAGYTPNGAIFEAALQRGTDCAVLEQGQKRGTWVFKRYKPQTKGTHYFSLSRESWRGIRARPWSEADDRRLETEFEGRYLPDSTDDTRRLQSGKAIKSPDQVREQLGLDPRKKTAVIFSHVAWDAAFFFGDCLFEDFEDWLYQTVDFAANRGDRLNWIVKIHPFNVFKLQRETVIETSEMRLLKPLFPLPEHVKLLQADTDINTKSLYPIVDYVLTVHGTVGMEFPCFGVPAIVAGSGRYSGLGFTVDPSSREEYFAILARLETLPRLTPEQRTLARKHFDGLMRLRQVSFEDAAHMDLKKLHEAQSDVHDNLRILPRSLDEFQRASSFRRLAEWLDESQEEDFCAWPIVSEVAPQ